jgi:hypothetical protein
MLLLDQTVNISVQEESNALKEVVIVSTKSNGAFNKGRTGASQQFSNREITAVPITGSRSISSVTKYNNNGFRWFFWWSRLKIEQLYY